MKTDESIMSFTFGEFAFLLFFSFAIIAAYNIAIQQKEQLDYESKLNQISIENQYLVGQVDSLKIELGPKGLPRCLDVGIYDDWLFQATIVGKNQFVIGNNIYSFQEIINIYDKELKEAECKCRHIVKFDFTDDIKSSDLSYSRKLLEQIFYVKDLGARNEHH